MIQIIIVFFIPIPCLVIHRHIHPGYSMFDWTRYTQTAGDLTGVGGQIRKVSQEELAKHNRDEDAWTVVRGMNG